VRRFVLDYYFVLKDRDGLFEAYEDDSFGLDSVFDELLENSGKPIKSSEHNPGYSYLDFILKNNIWSVPKNYFTGVLPCGDSYGYYHYCFCCERFFNGICTNCQSVRYTMRVVNGYGGVDGFEREIKNIFLKTFYRD
jgi:hypothetical protein